MPAEESQRKSISETGWKVTSTSWFAAKPPPGRKADQEGGFILRAVIFANGRLSLPVRIDDQDLLIAADGGSLHCIELGLVPEVVVGDLDSLSDEDLSKLKNHGAKIIRYPTHKDFTDLELALQHALELGAHEILIYGALGNRWDQTVANLLLAGAYPAAQIRLVDGSQEISYIHSGESRILEGYPGDTVSLIPVGGAAVGITTDGLEYPLRNETLGFGETRGVSNVLLGERAEIMLDKGMLVCVLQHRRRSPKKEIEQ